MRPDIIVSGEGLPGGLPIGLTVARPEVADALPPPAISTFGGNPPAAAAEPAQLPKAAREQMEAGCRTSSGGGAGRAGV